MPLAATPVLRAEFVATETELLADIRMSGPSHVHLECVAELIDQISKNSGVPKHEVLKDIARLL